MWAAIITVALQIIGFILEKVAADKEAIKAYKEFISVMIRKNLVNPAKLREEWLDLDPKFPGEK